MRRRVMRLVPFSLRRRLWYLRVHRRLLHLRRPQWFSEKVTWRILYDRRALLAETCDKLLMKEYAAQRCADLQLRIPAVFWAGSDVGELADIELPSRWVLKPNHRSGHVVLGHGAPDIDDLRARTRGWLDDTNWSELGEWAYGAARSLILAEEWVGDSGDVPADYKVFVFDGEPRLVQVDEDRYGGHRRRFYTPSWEPLPHLNGFAMAEPCRAPSELAALLEIAARLAAGFDFLRVDLYIADGEIWFGELTPYPAGGLMRFEPSDLDVTLGSYWRLPKLSH